MESLPLRSPLQDLIDHGLLSPPVEMEGLHRDRTYRATLDPQGAIVWQGETFSSPSVAAGHAISRTTGLMAPGRRYFSINGWKFWGIRDDAGEFRTLADLRAQLPAKG